MMLNLVKLFNKFIYEMIDAFMSNKPTFDPSHSPNFMDPNDNVYTPNSIC